ncbi:phosphoribosyltransferase [Allosaccharopolyspora coralli]|uniref:Phosphoribosyltransferase n=1 Tax=Allosaccharopolyspora coralli TaxID=2665642 RepID=A0A5Q3Q9N4_9PSEU|nr:phosphoribosyltransferase family protein [Allosaccharopolyspora coralli]QGK69914.1 phosphoribosyltransferase [Allosaccharopolyspora coralli]
MPVIRYPGGTAQHYEDRQHAGQVLASELAARVVHDPVVLGLARGGVPVAAEVATAMRAPLRVCVARKIGAPGQPELALGAVTADGPATYDPRLLRAFHTDEEQLRPECEREREEARRREERYQRADTSLRERDVILVDDGIATGATARAAVRMVRASVPHSIVFAVPVGAPEAVQSMEAEADTVVCPLQPSEFSAVGQWYRDFGATTDDEIVTLLAR